MVDQRQQQYQDYHQGRKYRPDNGACYLCGSANFSWCEYPEFRLVTAFSGDIAIPMIVNGNISKTLHVTVTGDDYNQSYSQNLGTAVYLDTPYIYTLPHPGTTGVYNVSFYLSNWIIPSRQRRFQ